MKNLEEVFCDTGRPTYTYVQPTEYLQTKVALRTPGKGVVIEGPSGIGKTTCLLATLDDLGYNARQLLSARKKEDREKIEKILANSRDAGLVIIDDFHKLEDNLKSEIADLLKTAAEERRNDVKLVLIGINNAGDHLINISPDLNDRIETIKFGVATDQQINQLVDKGERALNIKIEDRENLIRYSMGSFHIAQLLCHTLCILSDIDVEQDKEYQIKIAANVAVENRMNTLARTFSEARLKFALGNRNKRRGLLPYYSLLRRIGESNGTVSLSLLYIKEPKRKASFQQIINKGYLSQLINNNEQLNRLFFFDKGSKNLSVDDPKFLFFLRNTDWNSWEKEQGFIPDDKYSYDFAISFSGKVRDIAKKLADKMLEEEISIFYDEQESAYILGNDVEQYLAPIYASDSRFVVPIIDDTYAEHVWTRFEQDQYRYRFDEKSVIPIILSSYHERNNDPLLKIGVIKLNQDKDLDAGINHAVDLLKQKIEE